MVKERSAGAILFLKESGKNLFLLLNYPAGHWDFVKGKIEDNENSHQTAVRETKEETGIIDLEFFDNFEEEIEYYFSFNGDTIHKKVVFFLARTNTKNVKISHEHSSFIWLNYDDALEKITYQNAKEILKKANIYLQRLC